MLACQFPTCSAWARIPSAFECSVPPTENRGVAGSIPALATSECRIATGFSFTGGLRSSRHWATWPIWLLDSHRRKPSPRREIERNIELERPRCRSARTRIVLRSVRTSLGRTAARMSRVKCSWLSLSARGGADPSAYEKRARASKQESDMLVAMRLLVLRSGHRRWAPRCA